MRPFRRAVPALNAAANVAAVTALAVAVAAAVPSPAAARAWPAAVVAVVVAPLAAPAPADFCLEQCDDILPPGENGNATLAAILAHQVLGIRPAHSADQLAEYAALAAGYTGLTESQLDRFYNRAAFGVPAGEVESSYQPRADVTVVRDKATGVPHVTGTTSDLIAIAGVGDGGCAAGDQWCADSIVQQPLGGITHDRISWQNRPTYQQVVSFPARRGDGTVRAEARR